MVFEKAMSECKKFTYEKGRFPTVLILHPSEFEDLRAELEPEKFFKKEPDSDQRWMFLLNSDPVLVIRTYDVPTDVLLFV
mgnify:CR=1 FL=1